MRFSTQVLAVPATQDDTAISHQGHTIFLSGSIWPLILMLWALRNHNTVALLQVYTILGLENENRLRSSLPVLFPMTGGTVVLPPTAATSRLTTALLPTTISITCPTCLWEG